MQTKTAHKSAPKPMFSILIASAPLVTAVALVWIMTRDGMPGMVRTVVQIRGALIAVGLLGAIPPLLAVLAGKRAGLRRLAGGFAVLGILLPLSIGGFCAQGSLVFASETPPTLLISDGAGANGVPNLALTFRTAQATQNTLYFGEKEMDQQVAEPAPTRQHVLALKDLQPGAHYQWRLNDGGACSFTTPAIQTSNASDTLFHFGVGSDAHLSASGGSDPKIVSSVLKIAGAPENPFNAFFFLGDLVNMGNSAKDWQLALGTVAPYTCSLPLRPLEGNHDAYFNGTPQYEAYLYPQGMELQTGTPKYYRVDSGKVHFLMLQMLVGTDTFTPEERAWLVQQLESIPTADWTIVMTHAMVYASGSILNGYPYYDPADMLQQVAPLLEKYQVDLVLSGHDHQLEFLQKNGVTYAIAGGLGAPLNPVATHDSPASVWYDPQQYGFLDVTVHPDTIDLHFRDPDGKELKAFSIGQNLTGSNTGARLQNQVPSYPIASDVETTPQRAVLPDAIPSGAAKIDLDEVAKYKSNGYGAWQYGKGIAPERRLDLMPAGYPGASVTPAARLLNFFAMSDIHITDEETPAQAVWAGYKGANTSAYSPVMMLTTQVLDAAIQTANALHSQKPFDFGISLGDTVNSAQYNELRWYIDDLDGKVVSPDSGVKDDPVPGAHNDYQDAFQAAGLDQSIPWYQTLGNHDHWWLGSAPVTAALRQATIGKEILNQGDLFNDPAGSDSKGFYMGAFDGRTPNGDVFGFGPIAEFASPPQVLAADPNRRPLTPKEWMGEFFNTTSSPVGHGFTQANLESGFASYSFEPKADLPLKVIVLDDTQPDDNYNIKGQAYLDQARYDWLVSQLDQGQAEGKLMIIAAHIPIQLIGLTPNSPITAKMLLSKLQTYPNLVLWIAGHRHRNVVTVHKSPDPAHPELGFWEVETPSLRDFPQEFRTFEIDRNSDNTISIQIADVDPAVQEGSLAALSRSYAVATQQITQAQKDLLPACVYNAELVKPLNAAMAAKLQNYGKPIQ